MYHLLPPEDRNCELHETETEFTVSYHNTGGRWMRNTWELWDENSTLCKWFNEHGFTHADDMTATIFKAYWCQKKGEYFYLGDEADKYRDYWKSMTTMPVNTTVTLDDGTKVTVNIGS